MTPGENLARALISAAAFTAMMLAVYHVTIPPGRAKLLPAHAWKHSVLFHIRQAQAAR